MDWYLLWYQVHIRIYKRVRKIGRFIKGTRLVIAEGFLEEQWMHDGLVTHYDAQKVRGIVKSWTDVALTDGEVIQVVERVRARHGYPPRRYESYVLSKEGR